MKANFITLAILFACLAHCFSMHAGCDDPSACNYISTDSDSIDCNYPGCTDSLACNFDPTAGCDDGSCQVLDLCGFCDGSSIPGCLDSSACNFSSNADCDDASCLYADSCGMCGGIGTIAGCMDPLACNFDPTADCDDGSCSGLWGCTDSTACNYCSVCAGCDDGSCVFGTGCTDPIACNYDSTADCDDGSCLVNDACGNCGGSDTAGCTDSTACNFDPTADCDDGSCTFPGCTDSTADNYDSSAGCDNGSCVTCAGGEYPLVLDMFDAGNNGWNGASLTISDSGGSPVIVDQLSTGGSTCNPYCLVPDCYEVIVDEGSAPAEITYEISIIDGYHADDILFGVANDQQIISIGGSRGCTSPTATNYDSSASCDDGSCYECALDFFCVGNNSTACNSIRISGSGSIHILDPDGRDRGRRVNNVEDLIWEILWGELNGDYRIFRMRGDPFGGIEIDFADEVWSDYGLTTCFYIYIDENGNCTIEEYDWALASLGCIDSVACNYDSTATLDNGTCEFPECGDPLALNYVSTGLCIDNTLCIYVEGCTDPLSCNYDSLATQDDETCEHAGCTYNGACNYDSSAYCDDGSCDFFSCYGCTDTNASNYDSIATMDDGSCAFPPSGPCEADLTGDCVVDTGDLLEFLTSFGFPCFPCE